MSLRKTHWRFRWRVEALSLGVTWPEGGLQPSLNMQGGESDPSLAGDEVAAQQLTIAEDQTGARADDRRDDNVGRHAALLRVAREGGKGCVGDWEAAVNHSREACWWRAALARAQ